MAGLSMLYNDQAVRQLTDHHKVVLERCNMSVDSGPLLMVRGGGEAGPYMPTLIATTLPAGKWCGRRF